MDYKLVFEDGSEAIAHSGVKGMKWGAWNAETRARRTGGAKKTPLEKGYRPTQRQVQKASDRLSKAKSEQDGTAEQRIKLRKAQQHYEYVTSGKQAQRRARLATASAIVAGTIAAASTGGALGSVAAAYGNVAPAKIASIAASTGVSEGVVAKLSVGLASSQLASANHALGQAAVSAVVSKASHNTSKKYKK